MANTTQLVNLFKHVLKVEEQKENEETDKIVQQMTEKLNELMKQHIGEKL